MLKPRPVPFLLMLAESLPIPNSVKSHSLSSSEIPTPLSLTSKMIVCSFLTRQLNLMNPSKVNFKEFETRLKKTYFSHFWSVIISTSYTLSSSSQIVEKSSNPFPEVWSSKVLWMSSKREETLNLLSWSMKLLFCILALSNMSSIKHRRSSTLTWIVSRSL